MSVTDVIGAKEAEQMLGVPTSTFHRWIRTGRIVPAGRLTGRRGAYLFNRSEIEQLAATRKVCTCQK
ncbi:helix-turn-helix domain-containing protein [Rhodococcus sp. LW-XY12]|uniref:helix-turn-helix domain-containing protein n=1 Tax=Rhodococcus sp. LW-XY12 TaxID=2856851 RepID=UPI001C5872A5|nr:helix-turn-helix domain-containing protein [Rhodococcus sp. LW-XY12]QXU55215.1 helix-turn-helix domain-containing protein [Rhodococcus sp. LW-XY12]